MLIRIILFSILFYLFLKIIRSFFLKPGPNNRQIYKNFSFDNKNGSANEMVQDPVCKVYVPKREALTALHSGRTFFFCSNECLEKFNDQKVE